MHDRAYGIVVAALSTFALALLLALRFVGLYSHQVLALFLLLGVLWAILGPGGIAWKGRLRTEVRRALELNWNRHELRNAIARASFWGITTCPHTTNDSPPISSVWKMGPFSIPHPKQRVTRPRTAGTSRSCLRLTEELSSCEMTWRTQRESGL